MKYLYAILCTFLCWFLCCDVFATTAAAGCCCCCKFLSIIFVKSCNVFVVGSCVLDVWFIVVVVAAAAAAVVVVLLLLLCVIFLCSFASDSKFKNA